MAVRVTVPLPRSHQKTQNLSGSAPWSTPPRRPLSQAGDLLEVFPPVAIALAVFIWAIGITTGVATWGAAYRRST